MAGLVFKKRGILLAFALAALFLSVNFVFAETPTPSTSSQDNWLTSSWSFVSKNTEFIWKPIYR